MFALFLPTEISNPEESDPHVVRSLSLIHHWISLLMKLSFAELPDHLASPQFFLCIVLFPAVFSLFFSLQSRVPSTYLYFCVLEYYHGFFLFLLKKNPTKNKKTWFTNTSSLKTILKHRASLPKCEPLHQV